MTNNQKIDFTNEVTFKKISFTSMDKGLKGTWDNTNKKFTFDVTKFETGFYVVEAVAPVIAARPARSLVYIEDLQYASIPLFTTDSADPLKIKGCIVRSHSIAPMDVSDMPEDDTWIVLRRIA